MYIDVADLCGTDLISRKSGEKIRNLVVSNWNSPRITLDFKDRLVGSVSFFDEAFSLLIKKGGKDPAEVINKIELKGLRSEDRDLLNYVFATRVKEYEQSPRKRSHLAHLLSQRKK